MLSESARMSSAAEARFRLQTPNPTGRAVTVVALDPANDGVVTRLGKHASPGVTIFPASALADRASGLMDAVSNADLVVMVVTAGGDARAAPVIGAACSRDRVMTTTIVVRSPSSDDEVLSKTLAQVRPWSLMVVIASGDDYVEDVLRSFR